MIKQMISFKNGLKVATIGSKSVYISKTKDFPEQRVSTDPLSLIDSDVPFKLLVATYVM